MISKDRFEPVIAKAVADLQAELGSDLEGILLFGSVAYGTPQAHSDVDLHVLIAAPWRQRRTVLIDGVEVELFLNPPQVIRAEIHDLEDPKTAVMFARGRVLNDVNGVLASLVEESRERLAEPRPAVTEDQVFRLRYQATDLLKDALDLAEHDADAASWLIYKTLDSALEVHYRLQRRMPTRAKDLLADLREHAPDLEPRVRRILSSRSTIRSRCFWLSELVKDILQPLGGLIGAWEGPRIAVELEARPGEPRESRESGAS